MHSSEIIDRYIPRSMHQLKQMDETTLLDAITSMMVNYANAAVAAERERCAQVADAHRDKAGSAFFVCDFIAAAIRALG